MPRSSSICVQRGRSSSGAPLQSERVFPVRASVTTARESFFEESNGSNETRRQREGSGSAESESSSARSVALPPVLLPRTRTDWVLSAQPRA